MKRCGALDTIVDLPTLEGLSAFDAETPRLKRADTSGNDDRASKKCSVEGCAHGKAPVRLLSNFRHFLAEMEGRIEWLDLLQETIDELLCATDGQRGDVVDRLVRIELGTLPARMCERIDHVRRDAEQAQLENLEEAARSGSDDHHLAFDRGRRHLGHPGKT